MLKTNKLIEALTEIAYSKYCEYTDGIYTSDYDSGYRIGIADGHRFCAKIAREALDKNVEETKPKINYKVSDACFVALSLIKRLEEISEDEEDIYSRRLEIDAVKTLIKAGLGNK